MFFSYLVEILGVFNHGSDGPWDFATATVDGVDKYKRLAIRSCEIIRDNLFRC